MISNKISFRLDFVFQSEQWNRTNIFYSDDLDTLSYIPITTLYFDREKSIGPDDVYVTVINVPLLVNR